MTNAVKVDNSHESRPTGKGWQRLHDVAITVAPSQGPDYGRGALGELFGVTACKEAKSSVVARETVRQRRRPRRRGRSNGRALSGPRLLVKSGRSNRLRKSTGNNSAAQVDGGGGGKDTHCANMSSGAGPPRGAKVHGRNMYGADDGSSARTNEGVRDGPPTHAHLAEKGQPNRSSGSKLATGDRLVGDEKYSPHGRQVRPHLVRPPGRPERGQTEMSLSSCWTESAVLYSVEDGTTVSRRVRLKKIDSEPRQKNTVRMSNRRSRHGPTTTDGQDACQKVNERKTMIQKVGNKKPIRTARDGPPHEGGRA